MADYGLFCKWDEYQVEARVGSVGFSSSDDVTWPPPNATAQGMTRYQTALDPERLGIYLAVGINYQLDRMEWHFEIPDLLDAPMGSPIEYVDTDAGAASSGRLTCTLKNLRLYTFRDFIGLVEIAGFILFFNEVELAKDGSVVATWDFGGGGYSISNSILNPSAVPLIGIPVRGQIAAGPGPLLPSGPGTEPFSFETLVSGGAGWRIKETGASEYVAFPVLCEVEPFVGSCPCATETPTPPSASDTWNLDASAALGAENTVEEGELVVCPNPCVPPGPDASYRIDRAELRSWIWFAQVVGVPNLHQSVVKVNGDYASLWHRFPMPKCEVDLVTMCKEGEDEATATTTVYTDAVEVVAAQSALLQVVRETTAAIEDTFDGDVPAPYYFYSYERLVTSEYGVEVSPVQLCHPPQPPWSCFPEGYPITTFCESTAIADFAGADAPGAGAVTYLSSTSPIARYVDFISSRHWSMTYPFTDWAGLDRRDFWMKCRMQRLDDTTSEEEVFPRCSIIESPLDDKGFISLQEASWAGFRWLGVPFFQTDVVTPLAEYAYDDSLDLSMIDTVDCAVSLDPTAITVDPDALAASCEVKIRLGSFTKEPYLHPHAVKRFLLDWSATNVASMKVYLESVDGSRALFEQSPGDGFTTPGVVYDRPEGTDESYFGSWAIDNSNGQIGDAGSDSLPEGISAASMADPERCLAPQLLQGFGAKWLVFVIEPEDPDADVELEYPVLRYGNGNPEVTYEHGAAAIVTFPSNAGLRIGNHKHFSGGLSATPSVEGLGSHKTTVVDWGCLRRMLFEAKAHDDGLAAWLESLYDDQEGNDEETVDGFSLAFLLPMSGSSLFDPAIFDVGIAESRRKLTAALVNAWAAIPPMACFPHRRVDSNWQPTGDHELAAYSFSQGPRYYVSRSTFLHVLDGIVPITSEDGEASTGWKKTTHDAAFADPASATWNANHDGRNVALVSAAHGYLAVVGLFPDATDVSYDVSLGFRHARAVVMDGKVTLGVLDPATSSGWQDLDTDIDAERVCVRWDKSERGQRLYLWTVFEGELSLRYSDDEGEVWSMAETISASDVTDVGCDIGMNGLRYHYWIEGTDPYDVKGRIDDPQGNTIEATFTAVSGVDQYGISGREYVTEQGKHRIGLHVLEGGELKFYTSPEGKVFS